jgi:hypothetical protein
MSLADRKPVKGAYGDTMEVFNGWSAQRTEGRATEGGQTDGPNPERDHRKLGRPLGQDKEILGYFTSTLAHIHCPSASNPVPTPVEPKKPGTKTPPDSGGGGTPTPPDSGGGGTPTPRDSGGGRAVPTPRDWISVTERGPDTLGPGMVRD